MCRKFKQKKLISFLQTDVSGSNSSLFVRETMTGMWGTSRVCGGLAVTIVTYLYDT